MRLPVNVLFLCTGNSARSIMAESLLNGLGRGKFRACSAGSDPTGVVNRFARELLEARGLPADGLRSKSWDEFATLDSPRFDFVFTVCDQAAAESCPVWPGQPVTAHWGIKDPAKVEGDVEAKQRAFLRAFTELQARILLFVNLPIEHLERSALEHRVEEIGKEPFTLTA